MRQLLNNPWVVVGLCMVAVVILYVNAEDVPVSTESTRQALPIRSLIAPKALSSDLEKARVDFARITWPDQLSRDPFAPVSNKVGRSSQPKGIELGQESEPNLSVVRTMTALPPLRLSAITLEPKPKRAVINRSILSEGEEIEGLLVSRIESDGVWLKGASGLHHLAFEMKSSNGKTPQQEAKNSLDVKEFRQGQKASSVGTVQDCPKDSICS